MFFKKFSKNCIFPKFVLDQLWANLVFSFLSSQLLCLWQLKILIVSFDRKRSEVLMRGVLKRLHLNFWSNKLKNMKVVYGCKWSNFQIRIIRKLSSNFKLLLWTIFSEFVDEFDVCFLICMYEYTFYWYVIVTLRM